MKSRFFWRKILPLAVLLSVIWSVENYTIRVNEQTLLCEKISGPVKIVLISDLHSVKFGKNNKNLKGLIELEQPDVIFVLGDMHSHADDTATAVDLTTALTKTAPVFFVGGDHDYDEKYFQTLEDGGVNVLNFEKSDITVNGNDLSIYGIRSEWFPDTFDLNTCFGRADEARINILLAHCPLVEKFDSFENLDFIFSGDTHGGMVRLPFVGPLYCSEILLPEITCRDEMYDKGYYNLGDRQLFVTSGLGDYPLPLRFNNRPEIVTITLLQKEK